MSVQVLLGDCRDVLKTLVDGSVHCIVTSPPYFGLRDYGTGRWQGGDAACDHERTGTIRRAQANDIKGPGGVDGKNGTSYANMTKVIGGRCGKCDAQWVDRQIGLELTPEAFVDELVAVFREARRVLRDDGTLWVNIGDSFAGGGNGGGGAFAADRANWRVVPTRSGQRAAVGGLKPKDLIGIPWMLAAALRAPYYAGKIKDERDRVWLAAIVDGEGCFFIHKRKAGTRSYSKFERTDGTSADYMRTQDTFGAGLEISNTSKALIERVASIVPGGTYTEQTPEQNNNRRQVIYRWRLAPNAAKALAQELYPHLVAKQRQARLLFNCPSTGKAAAAAHQAMMDMHRGTDPGIDYPAPPSLFEPGWYLRQDIIWAKSNPMPESVTDRCTKSHEHVFMLSKSERYYFDQEAIAEPVSDQASVGRELPRDGEDRGDDLRGRKKRAGGTETRNKRDVWTIATEPSTIAHYAMMPTKLAETCILAGCPVGGTVLDPFGGAGTTGLVADRLQRNAVLIELGEDHAETARQRVAGDAGIFA